METKRFRIENAGRPQPVAIEQHGDALTVTFGASFTLSALPPSDARELANELLAAAEQVEEGGTYDSDLADAEARINDIIEGLTSLKAEPPQIVREGFDLEQAIEEFCSP